MKKAIESITHLQTDDSNGISAKQIYKKKKKKKGSFSIVPTEKIVLKMIKISQSSLKCYTKRHKKSNQKKRDGWLLDLGPNLGACQLNTIKNIVRLKLK